MPLEPRSLAYSRGGTAIVMAMIFLAFCGYLINQIFTDKPLLRNSLEEIGNITVTPDVEMCVQNTTMQVVSCSILYYNWTEAQIPDCWSQFFRPGRNDGSSTRCWYFSTNNSYHMAAGIVYDNRDALRRIDFYWRLDSLVNISYASLSLPAIALQLYDPRFTSWNTDTLGNTSYEKTVSTNIQLGASRATTFYNHTSITYYHQHKYRAIKPGDFGAIVGVKPAYTDVITLPNEQHHWPIQANPIKTGIPARNLYHGLFSVQLAKSTIDVETEVKQHTILSAVALAGGCYGVLTSIYILLFGMSRLTPWGLVHHIPTYISRKKHHADSDLYMNEEEMAHHNSSSEHTKERKSSLLVPWFFRDTLNGSKTYTSGERSDTFIRKMVDTTKPKTDETIHEMKNIDQITKIDSQVPLYSPEVNLLDTSHSNSFLSSAPDAVLFPSRPQIESHSDSAKTINLSSMDQVDSNMQMVIDLLHQEQQKSNSLNNRVEELEIILSKYFINTYYLDQIRSRKKSELFGDSNRTDSISRH
ncbi:hypothetical protein A0J61_06268 [Choanephora cucurbitarum]|uniref:Uncharacterized protein n=1 Tax=Choanephora cucurbitarum TaxID=101091 RepID=A0A1C7N9D0_9FUNG|nr:hypothetical protein A0J61_06268 [Choanephora cucurbitarum]